MDLKITSLNIEGFRAIQKLTLEKLGRVNLITGKNNSGKSSVLEAVRILASEAEPVVIDSILDYREETEDISEHKLDENEFPWSSLFNGFPESLYNAGKIHITSQGDTALTVTLDTELCIEQTDHAGGARLISFDEKCHDYSEGIIALTVKSSSVPDRKYSIYDLWEFPNARRRPRITSFPCLFCAPNFPNKTNALAQMWDNIALTDIESEIVNAMKSIDPTISAISMIGKTGSRKIIVRTTRQPRPVPLRSFGDGMNRLFGIILSLVNAKGGLLLIDEFENGLHYSIQADAWKIIFELATRLDIQVIATSHSWDAIEAFQEVANEKSEDGVLIRLTRRDEDIIPTVFTKDELAIATREHIEVR